VTSLPLVEKRAIGGAVALRLLGAWFAVALTAWIAAAVAAIFAAPDLAAARPWADAPVLATHLLALGVLPFAVAGASFHLLPVMLRNDLPSERALWAALGLLLAGPLVAVGLGVESEPLVRVGAAVVAAGLAIVLWELGTVVVRSPSGRMLIASRTGVALSLFHAAAALALGALVFAAEDGPVGGVSHARWLLVHLHVALLGWLALLVVAVGRTLVPMLALSATPERRSRPAEELLLTGGLWLLAAGIAAGSRWLELAGAAFAVLALARFALAVGRSLGRRRGPLEAPLAHVAAGIVFLVEAVVLGVVAVFRGDARVATAYVTVLLVGWGGGVVIGHVGKLLSLSVWVWWPPGPRPKQAELYPRRTGLAQAALFALGVQLLVAGTLAASSAAATAGAVALFASALLAAAGAATTWRRRADYSRSR
jgi:hypothetical protein